MNLKIDQTRIVFEHGTGIFVRAHDGERERNADIIELDRESLLAWLTSRGGSNPWAENVVLILLGHAVVQDERNYWREFPR